MSSHLRVFLGRTAAPAFILACSTQIFAQDVLKPFVADDGTPVMRATPVHPPRAQPVPEEDSDQPAEEAAPPVAAPVSPKIATPIPIERATPVRKTVALKPGARPQPPKEPEPPTAPQLSDPGEIRISPQAGGRTADQAQLAVADSYYQRKMYEMAASEYQRYLELYPVGPDAQTAYFRLAESYRQTGVINGAKTNYDLLLSRYQTGDFIGPAAYRLAEMYFGEKNYQLALPLFRRASVRLKDSTVVCAARFFTARCLEATYSRGEARAEYEQLAEIKENNPFADASRLSLALLLRDSNQVEEAVKQALQLAKQTQDPGLKAEAMVRAAIWQIDLSQNERTSPEKKKALSNKAASELRKALEEPGLGRWKEVAQMGLVRTYFDAGKYKQVIELFESDGDNFSSATKPELLLITADAKRHLGSYADALPIYDQILKEYPDSVYAKEAAYQRLVALYNGNDPKALEEIDAYLAANAPTDAKASSDRRDQAILMKAEMLFKQQNFKDAAPLYEQIGASRQLTGTLRAEAVYRFGWCSMETREFEKAIAAFTSVIDDYPTNKSVPSALAQRAQAYQEMNNLTAAEKDYDSIIRKFPSAAKEREIALKQKGLMRGEQKDDAAMVEAFERLLKNYPKSAAAPTAHYWIGTAAYNDKDYGKAIKHLTAARELDKEHYFEKATLKLLLASYYLENVDGVANEIDIYSKEGKSKTPVEVLRWLTETQMNAKAYDKAEKYLVMLTNREEVLPKDRLSLGKARLHLSEYKEAVEAFNAYLAVIKEPKDRALGLLDLARADIGLKQFDAAQNAVNEALALQSEGKVMGEASILAGDIEAARGSWDAAAKRYSSVAVVLDDEEVTPRALEKAVVAYGKAGQEADAKKAQNSLQSRYPEYFQRKTSAGK